MTACAAQRELADDLARTALASFHRIGLQDRTGNSIDAAVMGGEAIDTVAEFERQQSRFFRLAGKPFERFDDAGPCAPGHVEPRHRIAVAHGVIAAAFGPADYRKNTVSDPPQPAAFFAGGEGEIGLRPTPRPEVFVAVETGRAHPVLMRQVVTVLDAKPALLGRIDQKQPAERPEGLAAKALFTFLIDHNDPLAGRRDLGRGNKAGEPRAHHDDVSFACHRASPIFSINEAPNGWDGQP